MDEFQKNQESEEVTGFAPTTATPGALGGDLIATKAPESEEVKELTLEDLPVINLNLRHPQQVLTRNEMFILLSKKEEDMTDDEKIALKWALLRAKHHNSRPGKLTTKQRKAKQAKRKASNLSRKANRK